ncbi:hypothetical protein B0H14DRAFT_3464120 [Mycena olivaceomarginata]|nr:hypothetical protein B0H14DRAFT_3464120 [Mycena olivaceomarginata]
MCAHVATIQGLAEKLGCLHQDKPSDVQIIATLLVSLPPAYDTLIISLKLGHYQYDCPEPGPLVAAPPRADAPGVLVRERRESSGGDNGGIIHRKRSLLACFFVQQAPDDEVAIVLLRVCIEGWIDDK